MTSLPRTAAYLIQRSGDATDTEREAYEIRKKAVMVKLREGET
ncbi:hypothetical protein [Amycolatopsis speibonae]|uniref:Uncharacterized protein n=1 Tax=Amycolatopsis speibonae TaxID=1450224 RepID=A0ABV7NXS4_9PSEU